MDFMYFLLLRHVLENETLKDLFGLRKFCTEKSDNYLLGAFLVEFLTGWRFINLLDNNEGNNVMIQDHVKSVDFWNVREVKIAREVE